MICYTDGTPIEPYSGSMLALRKAADNNKQIDTELINNDITFCELFASWGRACCDRIFSEDDSEVSLTSSAFMECLVNDSSTELEHFEEAFENLITDFDHLICPSEKWKDICSLIDNALEMTTEKIKLRVKWVCGIMAKEPDLLFAEGEAWPKGFREQATPLSLLVIEDEMTFQMDWNQEAAYPFYYKALVNTAMHQKKINIKCQVDGSIHTVVILIPHNGALRAVFNARGNLVSLKGNLSPINKNSVMIVEMEDEGLSVKTWDIRYADSRSYETPDTVWDAAPNGVGGFFLLSDKAIKSSFLNVPEYDPKDMPIQIYGSKTDWAWLFPDGRLRCSNGKTYKGIIAVGENGTRIVFRDSSGTKTYRNGFVIPVTENEDAHMKNNLLDRFCAGDDSEYVTNGIKTIAIMGRGSLYVK